MCIDYKALKKVAIKKNFVLPQIDEFFNRLVGAKKSIWQLKVGVLPNLNWKWSYEKDKVSHKVWVWWIFGTTLWIVQCILDIQYLYEHHFLRWMTSW